MQQRYFLNLRPLTYSGTSITCLKIMGTNLITLKILHLSRYTVRSKNYLSFIYSILTTFWVSITSFALYVTRCPNK